MESLYSGGMFIMDVLDEMMRVGVLMEIKSMLWLDEKNGMKL